jgi:hypothetical protein
LADHDKRLAKIVQHLRVLQRDYCRCVANCVSKYCICLLVKSTVFHSATT